SMIMVVIVMLMIVMLMIVMVVVVIMVVVIVIMVVTMVIMNGVMIVLVLDERRQLFAGCRLVGHLGFRHDIIDNLLFEQRPADLHQGLRLLAVILKHL